MLEYHKFDTLTTNTELAKLREEVVDDGGKEVEGERSCPIKNCRYKFKLR